MMADLEYQIAEAIANDCIENGNGRFFVSVESGGATVEASGWHEVRGCREATTGAWVATFADLAVESLDAWAYDEEGNEKEAPAIDTAKIKRAFMEMVFS